MSDRRIEKDLCGIWQNQPVDTVRLAPEQLRAHGKKFHSRIRIRNGIEYAAAAFVVVAFGYRALHDPRTMAKIAAALIVSATLFVAYYLNRHGSSRTPPVESGTMSCIEFYRQELERQRDLLRSVWRWYLLPFVPGMLLYILAMTSNDGPLRLLTRAIALVVTTALFAGLGWLNALTARRLQKVIDHFASLAGQTKQSQ